MFVIGRIALVVVCAGIAVSFTPSADALTPTQVGRCLDSTGHSGLDTKSIIQGLDISPDQTRELRSRLSQFNTPKFVGLNGLGLTPEVIATLTRRLKATLAAWNAHPVGWPCPAFVHKLRTIAFVRDELVYNGFRPSMEFFTRSPRQIGVTAVRDGITYYGQFVRTGGNTVRLLLRSTHDGSVGTTFTLPFVP